MFSDWQKLTHVKKNFQQKSVSLISVESR